ncbi:AAA family ATPase [Microvirga sp. 17 mud 1-3]|uniref:AAA family ATPase n=1 Tax=Microvirga sp. 17 mud 1-3 TaxID=2082949 RepID=UPI0013A5438C|nr:AAA family ATPase [Microvirga sp. 17 mud 1-3]
MYFLQKAVISGFWGSKKVEIDFDQEVNFLIGKNGCGKTTFINMIAAALRLDLEILENTQFKQIHLILHDPEQKCIGDVIVDKTTKSSDLFSSMKYRVRRKRSDRYQTLIFDEAVDYGRTASGRVSTRRKLILNNSAISTTLGEMTRTSWLSIHRATLGRRFEDAEGIDSSVDKKVTELAQSFANYFSSLDTTARREMQSFQEFVFLQLLFDGKIPNVFSSQKLDVHEESSMLRKIFNEFQLTQQKFISKVDRHFGSVSKALTKISTGEQIEIGDYLALAHNQRIHDLVIEWKETQKRISSVYSPKNEFLTIMNSEYTNKELIISNRNEPVVRTDEGHMFRPTVMSSGEKQLFILLGEVLLQEGRPYIFIADEPELSLHVEWQSSLVTNMRKLNPNIQIIFATHSPDIVSVYEKNIIKMEEHV